MPTWSKLLARWARLHAQQMHRCLREQADTGPRVLRRLLQGALRVMDQVRSVTQQTARWFERRAKYSGEGMGFRSLEPLEQRLLMSGTPVLEPDGFVNRDWWQNPSGEIHVAAFEASPEYADTPTGSDTITSLRINDWDAPWFNDFGDNFGQRVTGYLVPDESGPHRFWIAADDVASFRLSRDADPANLVEVASVPAATGGVEFNKYASQKSALIDLVAGQSYALEIVHREGYGGDNAGVWWRKPSHGDHTAPAEAVPSAVLSSVPVGEASTDPAVSIAGADSTTVGDSYTITLSSENTSVTGWTIDWGDGTIDSFGDVSAAAHTYAAVSGSEPLTIVATASTADGTLAADPVSLAVNAPTVTAVEGDGQVSLCANMP